MENPEEILHSLEEFAKMKPKDIPRELEEYLKFVAKTGDPVYQWSAIKSLFREKLINVITEFYESCSSMEIPPCPNVDMFNYDLMKNFILEKLDTFASAPFTLQRICELLISPRKEYTRIDKYMRALEKNILVVSTTEPGGRRTENGEGIMNGIESDHDHVPEPANEINVEEMDDSPYIQTNNHIAELAEHLTFENAKHETQNMEIDTSVDSYASESKITPEESTSAASEELVCVQYVSIEPVIASSNQNTIEETKEADVSVTITAINTNENEIKCHTLEPEAQVEAVLTENIVENAEASSETDSENIDKSKTEMEAEVQMETETATQSIPEVTVEIQKDEAIQNQADPLSEVSTTCDPSSDQQKELSEELILSEVLPETAPNRQEGRVSPEASPENSITSSDSANSEPGAPSEASVEESVCSLNSESTDNEVKEIEEAMESEPISQKEDNTVDSTTKASGDNNADSETTEHSEKTPNEAEVSEQAIQKPAEEPIKETVDIDSTENDSQDTIETSVKTDETVAAPLIETVLVEAPPSELAQINSAISLPTDLTAENELLESNAEKDNSENILESHVEVKSAEESTVAKEEEECSKEDTAVSEKAPDGNPEEVSNKESEASDLLESS